MSVNKGTIEYFVPSSYADVNVYFD